jgi:hypothetical protein
MYFIKRKTTLLDKANNLITKFNLNYQTIDSLIEIIEIFI